MFRKEKELPVIHHEFPGSLFISPESHKQYKFEEQEDKKKIYIEKQKLLNRVVISFDPLATEAIIFSEVKNIRRKAHKVIKELSGKMKAKEKLACLTREIPNYIGWLERYDDIVKHCKKKYGARKLSIDEGVLKTPKEFNFTEMVPGNVLGDKYYDVAKGWKAAYKGAVKLIQAAPYITFSPSRTQKINKKRPKIETRKELEKKVKELEKELEKEREKNKK